MSQNINNNWDNTTEVDTVYGSLVKPFNPDKVAELVNAQFTIPPVAFNGVGPTDTLLAIGLPNPVTQADIDAALAKLNAICVDPTRNDQTEEQQEAAALQNKIDNAVADIATLTNDTAWNALTNAQKIETLRTIALHDTRSVRYLLRMEKKRQTGVWTAAGR